MATTDPSQDTGSHFIKTPIRAAAALLGIYIAMYLAVAGVIHVLASPDATAAVAPDTSTAHARAAGASSPSVGMSESPRSD